MRLLLDTCVIIDWLTDADPFERNVWDILNDPGTKGSLDLLDSWSKKKEVD